MVKNISFFYKYANDLNDFKQEEINTLITKINDKSFDSQHNDYLPLTITITPYFMERFNSLIPVPHLLNEVNSNIIKIIEELSSLSSISLKKIIETYKRKHNVLLRQTTVHRKLRNKLNIPTKKLQ